MPDKFLTVEKLKRLLSYNKESGVFVWNITITSKAVAGSQAGTIRNGYVVITIDGEKHRAHRLAWLYVYGEWPKSILDHKNRIKTDNRIDNLRESTFSANGQNQIKPQSHNKVGLIGVSRHSRHKKFVAQININGEKTYLGIFKTAEEAHQIYLEAKKKHHEAFTN